MTANKDRHVCAALSYLLLALGLTMLGTASSRADIPRTMPVQGVLANGAGTPKPDGPYTISFRLYSVPTEGIPVWSEESNVITVAGGKGHFAASLGGMTPLSGVTFDRPYWLEVQVQGDSPMVPRVPLASVPYAFATGAANLTLPFSGSANVATPGSALSITNTGSGAAVFGAASGSAPAIVGDHTGSTVAPGVEGRSASYDGVLGWSSAAYHAGVAGVSNGPQAGNGLYGRSENGGAGVYGVSQTGTGVVGVTESASVIGVHGVNTSTQGGSGVLGFSAGDTGIGVTGMGSTGVKGSGSFRGVGGDSPDGEGMAGFTNGGVAVIAYADPLGTLFRGIRRVGVQGSVFRVNSDGKVFADGGYQTGGADVAEFIASAEDPQPGDVVEIDADRDGHFRKSRAPNSTSVAGVISTLPGLSMGASNPAGKENAGPQLALVGRVPVNATCENGPIRRGDLLTSSSTPGRAMRAPKQPEPGTILGKALSPLATGQGTVEMLVMLR